MPRPLPEGYAEGEQLCEEGLLEEDEMGEEEEDEEDVEGVAMGVEMFRR